MRSLSRQSKPSPTNRERTGLQLVCNPASELAMRMIAADSKRFAGVGKGGSAPPLPCFPQLLPPRIGRSKKWLFVRCAALSPAGLLLMLNERASGTRTLLARTIC